MAYQDIRFAAGITKEGTEYSDKGRFTDGSLIRFRKNRAEKIGGWKTSGVAQSSGVSQNKFFEGSARELKSWISLSGQKFTAVGTEQKIYVKSGDVFYDVTPINSEAVSTNIFHVNVTVASGSNTINCIFLTSGGTVSPTRPASIGAGDTIHFSAFGFQDISLANFSVSDMSAGFTVTLVTQGSTEIITVPAPATATSTVLGKFMYVSEVVYGLTTTSGSSTLKITSGSDLVLTLDSYIIISGASDLGGGSNITAAMVNQEYKISEIIDLRNFEVELRNTNGAAVTASASVSSAGGANIAISFLLASGLNAYVSDIGFGAGVWSGNFGWGLDATLDAQNQLRVWTSDNFGENLIACPRALGIFRWTTSTGFTDSSGVRTASRMEALESIDGASLVPTKALAITVSEIDRHLIVLGCDPINDGGTARTGVIDPMLIAFSDQENDLDFEPKLTNTAGSLRLSSGSTIIGSIKNRQETVIFTDTAVYSMQFIGPPLTFAVNLINEGSGLVGPKACVNGPTGIFFASKTGFFTYTGAVRSLPCSVQDYIFDDIDLGQSFKCFMGINSEYDEMWFFYPSIEDGTREISRYSIYNYVDGFWSIGSMTRFGWQASGVDDRPIATFFSEEIQSGRLYEHENGYDDDEAAMTGVFLQSSDIDISSGNNFTFVRKILPDIEFIQDPLISSSQNMQIELQTISHPAASRQVSDSNIINVSDSTSVTNVRARSRAVALKFKSRDDFASKGFKWQVGTNRLDITPSGGR